MPDVTLKESAKRLLLDGLKEVVRQKIEEGLFDAALVSDAAVEVDQVETASEVHEGTMHIFMNIHWRFNEKGVVFVEGLGNE